MLLSGYYDEKIENKIHFQNRMSKICTDNKKPQLLPCYYPKYPVFWCRATTASATVCCVFSYVPHVTVNPYGVAAVAHGVDGGPGLSGLVVHTNTSLGLLFPSAFDAMSCTWTNNTCNETGMKQNIKGVGRRKQLVVEEMIHDHYSLQVDPWSSSLFH